MSAITPYLLLSNYTYSIDKRQSLSLDNHRQCHTCSVLLWVDKGSC